MKIKYLLCLLQAHALWKEINKFIVPLSNQCSFSCFSASQGHSHTLFYQFWVTRNPVLFLGFSLTHYFLKHYDAVQVRSTCWIRRLVLYRVCLFTSNLRITFASISVVPEVSNIHAYMLLHVSFALWSAAPLWDRRVIFLSACEEITFKDGLTGQVIVSLQFA